MVRSLCVTALEVRNRFDRPTPASVASSNMPKPIRRATVTMTTTQESPTKKARMDLVGGVVASPEAATTPAPGTMEHRKHTGTGTAVVSGTGAHYPISLFAPPPSARQPLLPCHVLEAFAQIQRQQASSRAGGMRNFKGGLHRGRIALV